MVGGFEKVEGCLVKGTGRWRVGERKGWVGGWHGVGWRLKGVLGGRVIRGFCGAR